MKRLFAMLLCSALLLGASGCGGGTSPDPSWPAGESGRVELKWYINFSWYNTPWGGNAVSDAITEKAGVDITFISPAGSETETPDALIAGNNLPNLVTLGWWEDQLSAIIVDDEREARERLREEIERFGAEYHMGYEMYEFDSAVAYLSAETRACDILYLDIDMPQMTGMELAEKIRETDSEVVIIFCTNLEQFALNGYSVSALGFLVKPVQWYSFHMYLDRALKAVQKKQAGRKTQKQEGLL